MTAQADAFETYANRKAVFKYFNNEILGGYGKPIPWNEGFWPMMAEVDNGMDHAELYPEAEALTKGLGLEDAKAALEAWVAQAEEAWEEEKEEYMYDYF